VDTVASWEQGLREPTPMARRLLDEIRRDQQHWRNILKKAVTSHEVEA
jgi:DNA-binding transcriptional regulator YiaG